MDRRQQMPLHIICQRCGYTYEDICKKCPECEVNREIQNDCEIITCMFCKERKQIPKDILKRRLCAECRVKCDKILKKKYFS